MIIDGIDKRIEFFLMDNIDNAATDNSVAVIDEIEPHDLPYLN